jgi:hypothetical protein
MRFARSLVQGAGAVLIALCCIVPFGCGSGSTGGITAGPLKDRDAVIAALPKGVTLESAILPDPMYGATSKTVEDALTSLLAYTKDGKIYDGGLGREIRFESPGKGSQKSTDKKSKKGAAPFTIIKLSQ